MEKYNNNRNYNTSYMYSLCKLTRYLVVLIWGYNPKIHLELNNIEIPARKVSYRLIILNGTDTLNEIKNFSLLVREELSMSR
jgi:hypothetical protein